MSRNLIVTCGTSQLEKKRIDAAMEAATADKSGKGKNEEKRKWKELHEHADKIRESAEGINENYIKKVTGVEKQGRDLTEEGKHCELLLSGLTKKWPDIEKVMKTDANPFGAEISTLYKMAKESSPLFVPATDSVVLLYSDTCSGAFCAGVLCRLLTQVYNLPQGTITCQKIDELQERPRAGMEQVAENNTRRALLEAHREGVQNIFVMTGGFKSTLPILTIIALVHNDHICYLFERSEKLRRVDLQATVQSSQRFWQFLPPFWNTEKKDEISITLTINSPFAQS